MVTSTILLKEKFSKASANYDKYSIIQQEIADQLFQRIDLTSSRFKILDVGIGTGYLTEKLKLQYPDLKPYGIDLAIGMLNMAKQNIPEASLIQADAKDLPFKDETFELVISNLSYQWISDLKYALGEVKRVLKNRGRFYLTVFSENTLKELRESIFALLNSYKRNEQKPSFAYLPNKLFIEELLEDVGLREIKIDLKLTRKYYSSLLELITWLKLIGANAYWPGSLYKGLSGRCFIENLAKYYETRFKDSGRIFATFETLFVESAK